MSRSRLPIGTFGDVSYRVLASGHILAGPAIGTGTVKPVKYRHPVPVAKLLNSS